MKKLIVMINLMILCLGMTFAKDITISVGAGENWKAKREPQVAIWLEDTEGNYIETLYVTEKASKKSWIFAPSSISRTSARAARSSGISILSMSNACKMFLCT